MRKMLLGLLISSLFIGIAGCSQDNRHGNGKIASSKREVSTFQKIVVKGALNIIIAANDPQKIQVTSDSNLLRDIKTEVKDNTLYIYADAAQQIYPSVTPSITVYTKRLIALNAIGANKINIANLKAKIFSVQSEGANILNLQGQINQLTMTLAGTNKVEAIPLRVESAAVNINGANTARLYVQKKLTINMSGAGLLEYNGEPEITQQVSGVGRILKIQKQ